MNKIEMTEKAYIAAGNIKLLGVAINALSGFMTVGIIDKNETKKMVGQLYLWQEELFNVIETTGEEG